MKTYHISSVLPDIKPIVDVKKADFSLCDPNADECVKKLASYLRGCSVSGYTLYGHQNDLHRKAGPSCFGWSCSDTFDATGSYSGVMGIDALSLTGCELGRAVWSQKKRVRKAVDLTVKAVKKGCIVSLSAHMPNFFLISQWIKGLGLEDLPENFRIQRNRDGKLNYRGYTPNVLEGNVVQNILPGKELNSIYTGYLDLVIEYCKALERKDIPLIFRPFHENTGGWFWWGCNTCTPEEFKSLWEYTWNYITVEHGVHNLIWAYSPGSEPKSIQDMEQRYPGDSCVDMIGFDMYQQFPNQKDSFWEQYSAQCNLVSLFSREHGKLFANTETGVAHPDNKALLESGNEEPKWYTKVFDICNKAGACYLLLWADFSLYGAYYQPWVAERYVKHHKIVRLAGHEMLDDFIDMYNDDRAIFASQVKWH